MINSNELLLENDLGRSLAEESKAATSQLYDGAHRLAYRVERVHFVDLVLGKLFPHSFIVLTEVQHETQQSTLGLVADLLR